MLGAKSYTIRMEQEKISEEEEESNHLVSV